ncbi:hypothetical protein GS597_07090 [Synechococcales cyanobacterium C]|uniref:Uncharacterized protein n=1 Tax=Petrachloros mirabilis ULC683 TaxID=2781853 RepID=A0A8K2A7N8_9CYAN|nr:hypothetical protein [Petrachloros mirabilis]NCJ06280.1 hypothetical protein [Petrachloros mirabilis ULC683]
MKTQNEILDQGYKALVNSLGVVDAIRFIQHFSPGYGDYTQERHEWLDQLSMNDFLVEMRKHKEIDNKSNFEEIIE